MSAFNYLTPQGLRRLETERKQLHEEERPKVVEAVSAAAALGDRSENADYQYGKRRLREIDSRLRFLNARLERVQVVDPLTQDTDRVVFGSWIQLEDENGLTKFYQIVGPDEIDPAKGLITHESPMGKAVLGKKPGDQFVVKTPAGEKDWILVKIAKRREDF